MQAMEGYLDKKGMWIIIALQLKENYLNIIQDNVQPKKIMYKFSRLKQLQLVLINN